MISVWSAAQIQGGRPYQEDRYAVVQNDCILYAGEQYPVPAGLLPAHWTLFVLADGMGGMGHGDVAATTLVEGFVETFLNLAHDNLPLRERMQRALDEANGMLAEVVAAQPGKRGMGATFIAVCWDASHGCCEWLSVGDSLLCRYRDDQWRQLNQKHTYEQLALAQRERGNVAEAEHFEQFGQALSSAVDGDPIALIDTPEQALEVQSGDVLIIASDGLETIATERLEQILAHRTGDWHQVQQQAQINAAVVDLRADFFAELRQLQRQSQDNTTVIVVGFFDLD